MMTYSEFLNPPAALRGKPFWSWNGKLEKAELLRQIHVLEEMGMGGFFMHSRTGLATEYLSEEWFDLVNFCSDIAKEKGMEAWLYDEDRWPSGSAGGKATKDPHYRMRYLRLEIVTEIPVFSELTIGAIALFRGRVDGRFLHEYQRLNLQSPEPLQHGEVYFYFTTEWMPPHHFYNDQAYLNTLDRKATEHFIEITHEAYRKNCGDRLGTSIRGIFTDEPHHGMVMCDLVFHNDIRDPQWVVPWTESFFPSFEERWGYDLVARLPELFLKLKGESHSLLKWHFMEHLQQMFLDQWARPLQEWCQRHQFQLTGHVLHEDTLMAQAVPCGSVMRYYEYLDSPGVDVLGYRNQNYWVVKQLTSVARQMGKKLLMSELYGITGWHTTFQDHKRIGDWQALLGINLRCHHLSWYTMQGESKRDYPASIFYQSNWYREYKIVEDYFSRVHLLMQQGEADCETLVITPIESLWSQVYAGWATWLESCSPEVNLIERDYQQLFEWLMKCQVDFDYGDEDHLHRFSKIEREGETPLFRLGKATYRVVIVGGLVTIRGTTLELLERFQNQGGKVIWLGRPPRLVDVIASDYPAKLAARGISVDWKFESLEKNLRNCLKSRSGVFEGQLRPEEMMIQRRRGDGFELLVILNLNQEKSRFLDFEFQCDIDFSVVTVERWDCLRGETIPIGIERGDDIERWSEELPPGGLACYWIKKAMVSIPQVNRSNRWSSPQPCGDHFIYDLDEANLFPLDYATYRVADGEWSKSMEVLKIDREIRQSHQISLRSGEMLQPWYAQEMIGGKSVAIALRFTFQIEEISLDLLELLVENPEQFEISVNQKNLDTGLILGWRIDPCFKRLTIPGEILRNGENTIELRSAFQFHSNIEAIYLSGPFGVFKGKAGMVLKTSPAILQSGDIVDQGYPFYSGKVSYQIKVQPEWRTKRVRLQFGSEGFACLSVRTQKEGAGTGIPWKPFEIILEGKELQDVIWVDYSLTRRNTFGPLHLIPKDQAGIGPGSFVSEGAEWSDEYQFFPSGMIEPVRVSYEVTSP